MNQLELLDGKVNPQDKQMEQAVLGAILLEKDAMLEVAKILKTDMFYFPVHQLIFSCFCQLFIENSPIDLLTVRDRLQKNGHLEQIGGAYYLAHLSNIIGSAANVEHHASIVKQLWIKRACIEIGYVVVRDGYEDGTDSIDLLGKALDKFTNLQNDIAREEGRTWLDVLNDKITAIEQAASKKDDEKYIIGKPTGLYTLDRKCLGYKDTNLVILAGRPAEGKSSLMVQGAHLSASRGIPVGIFSLEMSKEELMDKFLSMETGIDSERIQTGALKEHEWTKLHAAQSKMSDWPVYIDDTGGLNINDLESISKMWLHKFGIKLLYVDYLQLVEVVREKGKFTNREQELSQISRRLKKLAKVLGIPVIALCALSRQMDQRPVSDRRPKLTDLRESGALEQDANLVVFVFRPEEHGIPAFEDGSSTKGVTEFIIAKNRMGKKGIARANFIGSSNKFDDTDYSNFEVDYEQHGKSGEYDLGEGNWKKVELTDDSTPF